jgi:hypothetical protein
MLGKTNVDGLGLTDVDLDWCPYQILTSMGESKEARAIVIQVNPNKLINYTIMWTRTMVTCYVLWCVGWRCNVVPPIDFWEEIACYRLGWQIGISYEASLLVRFIRGQIGKSNKSFMLVEFSSLPHGLELLEDMSMTKMQL